MNTLPTIPDPKDPGAKKNDGYSKQVVPEKIVNEQDQNKINNSQANPDTKEAAEEAASPQSLNNTQGDLSENATDDPAHMTPETLEEDRKQRSGINP